MVFNTNIYKSVNCPKFSEPITLVATYRLNEDNHNATFMYATCSVVENKKLPYHKQNRELALHYCFDSQNCDLLKSFPLKINIKVNGYSL